MRERLQIGVLFSSEVDLAVPMIVCCSGVGARFPVSIGGDLRS